MTIVLDSGVYIASVFIEKFTVQAQGLLRQLDDTGATLHAPALLHYELVSVARKAVALGFMTPDEGLRSRDKFLDRPVTLHFDADLLRRAYDLAALYQQTRAYDAQYLALAERLACPFWTADERLYNSAKATFSSIFWLGNWQESSDSI